MHIDFKVKYLKVKNKIHEITYFGLVFVSSIIYTYIYINLESSDI